MKRCSIPLILVFVLLAAWTSTAPCAMTRQVTRSYELGSQRSAGLGAVMLAWRVTLSDPSQQAVTHSAHGTNPAFGVRYTQYELLWQGMEGTLAMVKVRETRGFVEADGRVSTTKFESQLGRDLAAGPIIELKGVTIRVDSANPARISFTVLKDKY